MDTATGSDHARDERSAISLRTLLGDLRPGDCKLHCAVWNGEEHPIEVMARSFEEWTWWNRYRADNNHFNRPLIFSMAQSLEGPDLWLFGGVFEVLARRDKPHAFSYDVTHRTDLLPGLTQRLMVQFALAGRQRRRVFETCVDEMAVAAILPEPYAGQASPGLDSICITLRDLDIVVQQGRLDWRGPLEAIKGIYVIHDRATGQAYVGSASGDIGVWSRWGQYVESLHGGNRALVELVGSKGSDYARENLVISLLEFFPARVPDDHVWQRESWWKETLMTRTFGLNRN